MPREVFKSLTAQEQKFIFHFLREGAVEEHIYIVEKKARIPRGDGIKLLRRKHVALEIERRKAQVELEQAKVIARDQNRIAEEEDRRQSVTLDKIEKKLDELIALDPKTHGALVLSAIQTGLVYTGTIRTGRMERLLPPQTPPDGNLPQGGNGFYESVFDRMRAEQGEIAAAPVEAAPILPESAPGQPVAAVPVSPVAPVAAAPRQPAAPRPAPPAGKTTGVVIT